jgi:DNA-binding NarL/FixJ family response regulator
MNISVCIVEDNSDIRFAMEAIIAMDPIYKLAGSFKNAEDALKKIPFIIPDIVLMDINLGNGKNGIECIRELKGNHPQILFMICTVYEDDEKIFEAIHAGASGYLLKKTVPQKILDAIGELYEGGAPMSSQIAIKIVKSMQAGLPFEKSEHTPVTKHLKKLSPRENEVLKMLASGMLYKEIASQMQLSTETIRKHVYNMYEKLHVHNRIGAVNKLYNR